MATLGSDHVSLKSDADHGEVSLTFDGEAYTRTLERRDGTVIFDGDLYLEDTELRSCSHSCSNPTRPVRRRLG